jgi:hypothetical protein
MLSGIARKLAGLTATSLFAALGGCGIILDSKTFDLPGITGVYLLESVDGLPVPANLPAEPGCTRLARNGQMEVAPKPIDGGTFYSWFAVILKTCSGSSTPTDETFDDLGSWTGSRKELQFHSGRGKGTYPVTPDESGPVTHIVAKRDGHTYRYRMAHATGDPVGYAWISTVDEAGGWVNWVAFSIETPDGLPTGGITNGDRAFGTAGAPGTWRMTVTPPEGYVVAPSQAHPLEFTVVAKQDTDVRFVLHKLP